MALPLSKIYTILYGDALKPANLGTLPTFADIGATVADYLSLSYRGSGTSRLSEVTL